MILVEDLRNFVVQGSQSIKDSLQKLNNNLGGFLVVTHNDGSFLGTMTDGDIRRFMLKSESPDLNSPNSLAVNKMASFVVEGESSDKLNDILKRFNFCPVVDEKNILKGIYQAHHRQIRIGSKFISDKHPCFIISEIGNNHNGSIDFAIELVNQAVAAGADCVKFQMRNMAKLYKFRNDAAEDLGAQYTFDLLDRFQLKNDELIQVFDYCKSIGTIPLCTPWDEDSLSVLEDYGMPAYKVASADMTNHIFLEKLIETRKPLLISTGMSTEKNIVETIALLERNRASYILLHCNSTYPAPFSDINLSYMKRIEKLSNNVVGYSGHERGIAVSIAAVALGAKVVERHFTLDKSMEGNDHRVSLLPNEFKQLVTGIRNTEAALGTDSARSVSQGELMNRETLGKSLYFVNAVSAGQVFQDKDFSVTSPGSGLPPIELKNVIGKTASKDFSAGDFIYPEDIGTVKFEQKKWSFKLPYGIPVRYHDFEDMYQDGNFDVVEFHLSYQDLKLDISQYLSRKYPYDLIVHCPELFEGDHVLDLVADDPDYLDQSLSNLDNTIAETLKIQQFFPNANKPLLITNVGGFSRAEFKTQEWRFEKYEKLAGILNKYKNSGVEIIPQTMPPFPWHFGGQSHHNLFVLKDEIISFCGKHNVRICLDISHTKLASQHSKSAFSTTIRELAPYTAHLHIADAQGTSGEGLQIGEGDIAFQDVWPEIQKLCSTASFVPEVWQGHKNNGSGFWEALDKLESFK